jgi:hypothetical protein
MFLCQFYPSFVPNNAIIGQTFRVIEIFRLLGLRPSHVDLMYMHFSRNHPDENGFVKISDLLESYDIIETPFIHAIFQCHGTSTSKVVDGSLSFDVWVITLYNLLTLNEDDISNFLFFILDLRGQQVFTKQEIQYFFRCIWGEYRYTTSKFIETNIERMPFNAKDEITTQSIIYFLDESPILMLPIYQLQETLRKKIGRDSFWNGIAKRRNKVYPGKIIFDICNDSINDSCIINFFDMLNTRMPMPVSLLMKLTSLKLVTEENKR